MSPKKLGRYDLIRVLGKGAMGLVYEGRDPNLDRRVAIKTIKVENLSDEAAAEYEVRFRTEARSAARLQHPNIVSVYDSDRDGDVAFLVMEFVEGDDLKHHLDKGEVYTLAQTLGIMGDLLSALSYAHQQKIVHRDIKPANLLVQASGRIKLADFGVARIQDSGDATRTQGSIVGTLKYMSPEQLEGKPIDARADLFAAGVVLYQLLTGARPFDGDTDFAVIQKIVNHTPTAATFYNPKLPPAIDAVVAKSMAKSRDARYATAQEFATALQNACIEASDTTVAPAGTLPAKGSNTTWTATMMPGESLIATESGVATGSGVTSGSASSLVTQEVELVYWKDVKDSKDIESIQGFLDKFPIGIYADLARRLLKNLSASSGSSAVDKTMVVDKTVVIDKTLAIDKTLVMARAGVDAASQVVGAGEASAALLQARATVPVQIPVKPIQPIKTIEPRRKMLWVLGGAAVLAVAGIALRSVSGSGSASAPMQAINPQLATSAPGTPGNPAPPDTSVASASAANSALTASTLPAAVASASAPLKAASEPLAAAAPSKAASRPIASATAAAVTALRPATAASKAAPTAKKAGAEGDTPTRQEPAKSSDRSAATAPQALATTSPRTACEDRMLLGFQSCMAEQCAKPVFAQHAICVERRAMDERRRDAERNR